MEPGPSRTTLRSTTTAISLASQTYFRERMRAKKGEGEEGKNTSGTIARISCPRGMCGMSSLGQLHMWIPDWSTRCPDKCFGYTVVLPRTDCWEGSRVCYRPGGVAKTVVGGFASYGNVQLSGTSCAASASLDSILAY